MQISKISCPTLLDFVHFQGRIYGKKEQRARASPLSPYFFSKKIAHKQRIEKHNINEIYQIEPKKWPSNINKICQIEPKK